MSKDTYLNNSRQAPSKVREHFTFIFLPLCFFGVLFHIWVVGRISQHWWRKGPTKCILKYVLMCMCIAMKENGTFWILLHWIYIFYFWKSESSWGWLGNTSRYNLIVIWHVSIILVNISYHSPCNVTSQFFWSVVGVLK